MMRCRDIPGQTSYANSCFANHLFPADGAEAFHLRESPDRLGAPKEKPAVLSARGHSMILRVQLKPDANRHLHAPTGDRA